MMAARPRAAIQLRGGMLPCGASWQAAMFHKLYEDRKLDRADALREMTVRYRELMHANEPVHTWPVD